LPSRFPPSPLSLREEEKEKRRKKKWRAKEKQRLQLAKHCRNALLPQKEKSCCSTHCNIEWKKKFLSRVGDVNTGQVSLVQLKHSAAKQKQSKKLLSPRGVFTLTAFYHTQAFSPLPLSRKKRNEEKIFTQLMLTCPDKEKWTRNSPKVLFCKKLNTDFWKKRKKKRAEFPRARPNLGSREESQSFLLCVTQVNGSPVFFGVTFVSLSTTSSTFNSLFRVLCIFPSRYLCAIGLLPKYLALDGVYHPTLGCILKQPDSRRNE